MKYKLAIYSFFNLVTISAYATVSSGPYFGVEIGGSSQTMNYNASSFDINLSGNNISDSSWTFIGRLNLGYNFSKFNGLELGYSLNALPEYTYPGATGAFSGNVSTLDASYILSIPTIIQKFSIFGRIGVGYDFINSSSSSTSVASPSGANFTDVLGAGIKYNLTPKTSFRLEWIENGLLFPVNLNSGSGNITTFSAQSFLLGFNYHF